MAQNTNENAWEEAMLQRIVGEQLSSVEFVQDYVQLRFDGPTLTVITPPAVQVQHGQTIQWSEPGFRDALCERIGRKVLAATIRPGDAIRIQFDDQTSFSVSIEPAHRRADEAVHYTSDGDWWSL